MQDPIGLPTPHMGIFPIPKTQTKEERKQRRQAKRTGRDLYVHGVGMTVGLGPNPDLVDPTYFRVWVQLNMTHQVLSESRSKRHGSDLKNSDLDLIQDPLMFFFKKNVAKAIG